MSKNKLILGFISLSVIGILMFLVSRRFSAITGAVTGAVSNDTGSIILIIMLLIAILIIALLLISRYAITKKINTKNKI